MILGALVSGCGVNPYINVNYQIPKPSDMLSGRKVYLEFKDVRTDKTILMKGQAEHFKHFRGRFNLFSGHTEQNMKFVGNYDLEDMFTAAFKKRFENLGVSVLQTKRENAAVLVITLNQCILDFEDKKWIARVRYTARLMLGNGDYVGETVSGTAERLKIFGRKEAEKALSEVVTDTVNELDIQRLFQKAAMRSQ
jgi:hypothetical protein